MDLERIYDKLERMDEKMDSHMLKVENRVSTLEEKQKSTQGTIRLGLGMMISIITAGATYVLKNLLNLKI